MLVLRAEDGSQVEGRPGGSTEAVHRPIHKILH